MLAGDGIEKRLSSTEKHYIIYSIHNVVSKGESGKQKEGVAAITPSAHIHSATQTPSASRDCQ